MIRINSIYINGAFTAPHGTATFDLISPIDNTLQGILALGDEEDVNRAVAAAKAAFQTFSQTTVAQRIAFLQQMHDAISRRADELTNIMVQEYGGSILFCRNSTQNALNSIQTNIALLQQFEFTRKAGTATVRLEPVGVAGIITPWNASNSFICGKLSTAIAAGCTAVIKPSELSGRQTQLLLECLHEAGLPDGVFNVVNGLGNVVGAAITAHKDIAKISFTGSTITGKTIARGAVDTMKRITLELGGKSPNILLEDADLKTAIPMAIQAAYMNSGQACIAGTRLLVPASRIDEVKQLLKENMDIARVGNPAEEDTLIGPMVSQKQYERVQQYIQLGIEEGAELWIGGPGKPAHLEAGNFVKPTIFVNVTNDMRIAREEIFGPVLSVISYKDEEEAIAIANDTDYGLLAYVSSASDEHANHVAARIRAGRVLINGLKHDPMAPFGGFKQSGIGREYGVYGLEAYLEPKAILN
ncbi:MAG: aldehyde dehydrogenase family protein [Bacteroidetes bacterium 43-93]|nr:aldehyde dehydrogenase family protein [Bacteroidota bacterium]OJW97537.1 MAG: aldehyde dehydrogenase family protein [Bacteroidetes bacterium 43-93]